MGNDDARVRRTATRRQEPPATASISRAAHEGPSSGERMLPHPRMRRAGQSGAVAHGTAPVEATSATIRPHPHTPGSPSLRGMRLQPGWVLLPLRLFLGVTFLYAGIQKLTDPQFFKPGARDYIGTQIQAFAHGSPLGGVLLHVVAPHAAFFGGLIAYGEVAIGLGTLVGLLARPAAMFGGLLSLIFFLSATWHVYPYFYGADIVFVCAWITLGLRPHAGLPNLDQRAAAWLTRRWQTASYARALTLLWLFSVPDGGAEIARWLPAPAPMVDMRARQRHPGRALAARQQSRRTFLTGLGAGIAGTLGLIWLWSALHPAPDASSLPASTGTSSGNTGGAVGAASQSTAPASSVIAKTSDVPTNAATTFTLPGNQDPGVVVHLADGRFVAYDATCTHAGCPVQFDPGSGDLYCPCHGAAFDPANGGAVLQGPADTPLVAVKINVASNGDITLTT